MSSLWAPDQPASRLQQPPPVTGEVSFCSTTTREREDRSGAAVSSPPTSARRKEKTPKEAEHFTISPRPEQPCSPATASSMHPPREPSTHSEKPAAILRWS